MFQNDGERGLPKLRPLSSITVITFQILTLFMGLLWVTPLPANAATSPNTVNPNVTVAATHFSLTGLPDSFTAGSEQTVTVTALNSGNYTVTNYTGTITLDSPQDGFDSYVVYTFTPSDNGVHTFPVSFHWAINVTVTAVDNSNSNIRGVSQNLTIVAGPAVGFDVKYTCCTTAGGSMNFAVTAIDTFGNADRNYTGIVHFTSSDPLAVLPDDMEYTLENGGGRNMTIILKTAGGQTVTATDTVNLSITGTKYMQVRPDGSNVIFSLTTASTATGGTAQDVTLLVKDTYGNVATNYSGTVYFTSTDALAVLPEDYTFSNPDAGTHTFPVTFKTGGSQSVTATDTVNSDFTATASTTVQVLRVIHAEATYPNSSVSGTSHDLVVTLKDGDNNIATDYTGTIHFSSSDAAAVLPTNYTFTDTDAGTHTFPVTLKTVGTQSITATDTVNSDITASVTGINVQPDVDLDLSLVSSKPMPTQGDILDLTFTLKNLGSTGAHNSKVVVTLPAGLTLNTNFSTQGSYNSATGTWTVGTVNKGVNPTLTLNATVNTGGILTISGVASADESETVTGNNQTSLPLLSQALGGISVAITTDNASPKNGNEVQLTVKITSGPNPVTGARVNVTLPDGLTITGNTPTAGTYNTSGNVWTVGNLSINTTQTLVLTGKVGLSGRLQVTVTGSANEPDLNLADNTASVTLNSLPKVGLKITTTVQTPDGATSVKPGDTISVEANLTNQGPDDASNVTLNVQTPTNTTLQSYKITFSEQTGPPNAARKNNPTDNLSATYEPSTGKVIIDTLPAGVTMKFTLTSTVTGPGDLTFSFITNSDQGGGSGEGTGTVTLASAAPKQKVIPAQLAGQLRVTPDRQVSVEDGAAITYTLTVNNFGAGAANGVQVNWPLDANLTPGYVTFSDSRAWVSSLDAAAGQMIFTLPVLSPGQSITATVVMKALDSAAAGTSVTTHPTIRWNDDEASGKSVTSNAVQLNINVDGTTRNDTNGAVQYFANPSITVGAGQKFTVQGDFYSSNDLVTFWYTNSQGASTFLGTVAANDQGTVSFEVNIPGSKAGEVYSISGYGNHSEVTGSGTVTITGSGS